MSPAEIKVPKNVYVGELFRLSRELGGTVRTHEVTYNTRANNVIRAFLQRTSKQSSEDKTVYKIEIVPTLNKTSDERRGWLLRKRKFWSRNDAPKWSKVISGFDKQSLEGLEVAQWNEKKKALYTYTRNISLRKFIVAEEICWIGVDPNDENKCRKVCEVRFRMVLRGPWLLGIHKICERWFARRYERLVKETTQMECDRIEALRKMEEYVKSMIDGTKATPSLDKLEKFVSACEQTNIFVGQQQLSSLDSSVNMSLSPERTCSALKITPTNNNRNDHNDEDENDDENRYSTSNITPRSSDGTEKFAPDFNDYCEDDDDEHEEEQNEVAAAKEYKSTTIQAKEKENCVSKGTPSSNANHQASKAAAATNQHEQEKKPPLRVLFQNANFNVTMQ